MASLLGRLAEPVVVLGRERPVAGLRKALERRLGPELAGRHFRFADQASGCASALSGSRVVLGEPGVLAQYADRSCCGRLGWFQSSWAGVNPLLGQTSNRGYRCSRLGGCFGPYMAEYVIGWLVHHERSFDRLLAAQSERVWRGETSAGWQSYRPVRGLCLGVLGCGEIGRELLRAVKLGLGCRTVGLRSGPGGPALEGVDVLTDELDLVLRSADCIVNLLPSTPHTRGLLDNRLGPCAARQPLFINVGRGDVISEPYLLEALDRRLIARAVLDVFETEPLDRASRLWTHERAVITPHVAAISAPDDVLDCFFSNLQRYLDNEPLRYLVDWQKGY